MRTDFAFSGAPDEERDAPGKGERVARAARLLLAEGEFALDVADAFISRNAFTQTEALNLRKVFGVLAAEAGRARLLGSEIRK